MSTFSVAATLTFLYYADLAKAADFYERVLGLTLAVEQGYAKIYQVTPQSFIGLVDGAHGTHPVSEAKPVIVSFVTNDLEQWYSHLTQHGVTIKLPLQTSDRIGVQTFMALDPEGYVLEFETFLDQPRNQVIRAALALT